MNDYSVYGAKPPYTPFYKMRLHIEHASMYPPDLAEQELAKAEHIFDETHKYLLDALEDLVKSAKQRNDDGFHNYEICAGEEAIKRAKGLPFDSYYFKECP